MKFVARHFGIAHLLSTALGDATLDKMAFRLNFTNEKSEEKMVG
jgi:hypothetical protein